MKKYLFSLLLIIMTSGSGFAQAADESSLSGYVYDNANKEALIGVNVYIADLLVGAATNTSGYYIIPKVPPGDYTIIFEYLGYRTASRKVTLEAEEDKVLDFFLSEAVVEGQVVQVVADSIRVSEKLYRKPVSNVQLNARQINAIPQVAESDLLRSLHSLPGILPVSDFSSALYVRGGTPDQNLYLLDGTDVYNPEHAFGIFSTFNTDAIKHVDISKGGFSAAYGGRLSSVLDVINLDGNREEFEGSAAISLLSAKTTLQMPIGNSGAISGSIRRTYFDQTIAGAIDEIPDYYFYDGNLKAFYEIDKKNKLTLSGYGGRDVLRVIFNEDASEEAALETDWGNKTGSLKWTRVFNPRLFANFWITGSRFTGNLNLGETIPVNERNFISDLTFKGNMEYHYSQEFLAQFGFEQKNLHVIFRQDFPGGEVDVDENGTHYVGYLQGNWRPGSRWDIEAGLRFNVFNSDTTYRNAEPRLSLKYRLNKTTNLKLASGVYYQYLQRIPRSFVTDIWANTNSFQPPSNARHFILGFQKEIAENYQFEVETYYKEYENIYRFDPNFLTSLEAGRFNDDNEPVFTSAKGLFNQGDGESYGFEMILRKDVGAMTGWIGYSYARTEYKFPSINDGEVFLPRHDRRSTLNVVGNIDVKNLINHTQGKPFRKHRGNWRVGVNLIYASGQPITMPGSAYITGSAPNANNRFVSYYPAAINNYRLPHYARLDLSISYKRQYSGWTFSPYLQIYNIGNRKNVWFIDYDYSNGISDIETINMFPILPTIGVNFTF